MMSTLESLLVRPGMRVDVRGQLAAHRDDVVVTGYRMLRTAPGEIATLKWDQTPYLAVDDPSPALRPLLGATVYGQAVWDRDGLRECSLVEDDAWTRERLVPYEKDLTPVSDHVRSVETGLFSRGVMLRRVRFFDEHGPRVMVSATDVDEATRVLRPIYGDDLEVVRSRWSASELRGLDDVLNDIAEDRVLKVEYRMDGDGVVSRKLRVDHVDGELVRALSPFPPEMLTVEALVEPEGTPQDRDPWFPPYPRAARP